MASNLRVMVTNIVIFNDSIVPVGLLRVPRQQWSVCLFNIVGSALSRRTNTDLSAKVVDVLSEHTTLK